MKLLITAPTFAPSLDGPTFLGGNSFADLEEDNARAVVAAGKGLYIDGKDDKTRGKVFTASQDRIDAVQAAIKAVAKPAKQAAGADRQESPAA